MTATDDNQRLTARNMYWQGYSTAEISRQLGIPYGTVDAWKRRDEWDKAPVVVRIESHVETRLMRLIAKPDKLYGQGIGSSYQRQGLVLGKHFRRRA